ncbi:MAG: formylglycine-generating enzyme family protein, partial [Phycisphaerae bacterium]
IKRIIERLASPKTVPKDLWRLPTVDALELPDGITLRLVLVPAGKFVMGSTDDEIGREHDEGPRREVTISSAFFMGMFEVTQEQYQAVMGDNPSHYKGRLDPVHRETWFEATAFCQKLSKRTARAVRLPTEAEWEYACRAGTTTSFNTGRTLTAEQANYDGRMPYGADRPSRFRGRTAPVGSYRPNAWGLYDMHGNVWEWCSDWHSHSYFGAADVDPKGAPRGRVRILRGGAWSYDANGCRSADRGYQLPDARSVNFGFRVAVESDASD